MKKRFTTLKEMIYIVQLEEFVDTFEDDMAKRRKDTLKKAILIFGPTFLSALISLITYNPIFFCCGIGYMGIGTIIKMLHDDYKISQKEYEENEKLLRSLNENNQESSKQQEKKILNFNNGPTLDEKVFGISRIVNYKDEDFYTEETQKIKESLNAGETPINPKEKPSLEILENDAPLDKTATQTQITKEYEFYSFMYKLPQMTIPPREWDLLFDVVYDRLQDIGIPEEFYRLMNFILQYAVSSSLIHKKREIRIYDFITAILKLNVIGFDEREAKSIANILNEKINKNSSKLIDFKKLLYSKKSN